MDADIAVVDTGVFDHIDLNLAGGADCHAGEGFDDADGHGTLVAGFAAAEDNAFGAVGVAPGARIWAVRIEDPDGNISLANELCGLDWIHGHGGIDVANLSFGDTGFDKGNCGLASVPLLDLRALGLDLSLGRTRLDVIDPEHFAICRVHQAGTTVVVSAGNDAADTTLVTPAAYPEVITVSAYSDLDGHPGGLGPEPCRLEPQEEDDVAGDLLELRTARRPRRPGRVHHLDDPAPVPRQPRHWDVRDRHRQQLLHPPRDRSRRAPQGPPSRMVAGTASVTNCCVPPNRAPSAATPIRYAEGLLNVRSF